MVGPSFGVYLLLGHPTPSAFLDALEGLRACTDFYEIGIPSPRPKYDGPVIRRAHRSVIERGGHRVGLPRADGSPAIVMAYLEDMGLDGLERLSREAALRGYSSVLLPDLLFEYYDLVGEYVEIVKGAGMRPSFFASSRFPHRVLERLREEDPLLVYLGLQPSTGVRLPISVERNVRLARRILGDGVFLLAGFAVRSPDAVRRLIEAGADGVVVGSALIERLERLGVEAAVEYACSLHEAAHRG